MIIIYKIEQKDLEQEGKTVSCKINYIHTGIRYNFSKLGESYTAFSSIISKDIERNNLILDCVCRDMDDGRVPLLLTERVFHGRFLLSLLKNKGYDVGLIVGSTPTPIREEIKNKMRDGRLQILVANKQIAAEGLDIPIVDSVHVCFWTAHTGLLKQIIGRGRRSYKDKKYCRVWIYKDFVYKIETDSNFQEKVVEIGSMKFQFENVKRFFTRERFESITLRNGDFMEVL